MLQRIPVRTPTLPPATTTNAYRCGRVVVDPGSPWADEQARLAGLLGGGVEVILVTHHHHDHVGGVADLVARTGAQVWAHADARLDVHVDRRLADDEVIDTGAGRWRCFHTPGHADGHLVFVDEATGDVVAGDLVAGEGTIVVAPPEGHLRTYLASLERMISRTGVLHPAHGPALTDGAGALRGYLAHRARRTEQVRAALDRIGSGASARGIAELVYDGIPGVDLALASAQVSAHLVWLEEEGLARRSAGGGGGWQAARP